MTSSVSPSSATPLDEEAERTFRITLTWQARRSLASFIRSPPSGGGLYVIERGGRPLYVGEASSYTSRFRKGYLQTLNAFAVSFSGYNVRSARLSGSATSARRKDAEHAVVRAITHHYGARGAASPLRNRSSFRAFRVTGSGFTLINLGKKPPYLPSSPVTRTAGARYEVEPVGRAFLAGASA